MLTAFQILDLRERGAETVAHSEGTGVGAFATKSGVTTSSNGPPHVKRGGVVIRHRGPGSTIASNIMLSTIGSIQPDLEAADVELDEMHFESGMGFAGDSSRTLGSLEHTSPAPAYNSIEIGSPAGRGSVSDGGEAEAMSGIRVNVEKSTSTM